MRIEIISKFYNMSNTVIVLVILLFICIATIVLLYTRNSIVRKNINSDKHKLKEELERILISKMMELSQSEKRYRLLVENTSDIISLHTIDATYTYISESGKSIIGYDSEEMIGRSPFDFSHPDDKEKVQSAYMTLILEPKMKPLEMRFLKKDGSYFWIELTATTLSDEKGNITGIIASTREISDRKKAESELMEYKAIMSALLENSSDSIWSIDKNFHLIGFNNSFFDSTKLFYGTEPFIGMPILNHLGVEGQKRWSILYERVLNGERFSEETNEESLGVQLYFDVSFNPIIINNNEVVGAAIFARNITSRKNAEQQLEYKVKELNIFMYKATHDLRSPLVSIMGLVRLSKELNKEKELERYIDMIDLSVHKMDNLLIDLVKIVNVSQGKLLNDEIDFEWMIDEILTSLAHRPEFSEIIFRIHLNADFAFRTDSGLLYSVLQNIIDNSIKYKKQNDVIESLIIITVDVTAEQVKIGITDNGMGIPEELQDKVFDMFYRATTHSTGTGLGLYIVKTSVEKMNGKIVLSSIYEKGTSINIIFPNKALI